MNALHIEEVMLANRTGLCVCCAGGRRGSSIGARRVPLLSTVAEKGHFNKRPGGNAGRGLRLE